MGNLRFLFISLCVACLIVAGCFSPVQTSNTLQNKSTVQQVTPSATQSQTTVQTLQTKCPMGNNTTPSITLNPVGDHYLGDVIELNGTTNCNTGDIQVLIQSLNFKPCPKNSGTDDSPAPCAGGVSLNVPITPGTCGNNTWSVGVNTSEHHFYPDEFGIYLYDLDCASYEGFYGSFNLTKLPKSETRS